MKNSYLSLISILFCTSILYSCNETHTIYPPLSNGKAIDSIKKDELNYPIIHKHLVLAQRAVIRPIYEEVEKDVKAEHKGYLILITLKNEAGNAAYTNIKLEITYFSAQGKEINQEEIVIKKEIKPMQILKVSPKVKRYKNTNYKVRLVSASSTPS
jgi:hypothetical protein